MIQTIIDPMVAEAMQLTCSSPSLSCLYVLFIIILAYVSFLNPRLLPRRFLVSSSQILFLSLLSLYLILPFFLYTNDRRVFRQPRPQHRPNSPKRQGMSSLQVRLPPLIPTTNPSDDSLASSRKRKMVTHPPPCPPPPPLPLPVLMLRS